MLDIYAYCISVLYVLPVGSVDVQLYKSGFTGCADEMKRHVQLVI